MSKTITVSEEVYRKLEREKGDRSFDEVIAAALQRGGTLADVTGAGVLDPETVDAVNDDIERLG